MISVSGDVQSLFIMLDMLIWILTYLFLIYQNYPKYNRRAMTISKDLIMTILCGYTIVIGKYYQKYIFFDGYPHILTCKYHEGGCNFILIYCCRWRTNIPPSVYDQVCHAIVKPRTVKHMKVWYNYAGYLMV